jgi:hypothetical protein
VLAHPGNGFGIIDALEILLILLSKDEITSRGLAQPSPMFLGRIKLEANSYASRCTILSLFDSHLSNHMHVLASFFEETSEVVSAVPSSFDVSFSWHVVDPEFHGLIEVDLSLFRKGSHRHFHSKRTTPSELKNSEYCTIQSTSTS